MRKEQNTSGNENTGPVITGRALFQFTQAQLAQSPANRFKANSTSAILVCAYIMGAAEAFCSDEEALQLTLAKQLGLDDRGTLHLIDTTRRLARKYIFVAQILDQGRDAASGWQKQDGQSAVTHLAQLLEQHQNLTLMQLDIQGVVAPEPAETTMDAKSRSGRNKRRGLKLLLLLLMLAMILTTAIILY